MNWETGGFRKLGILLAQRYADFAHLSIGSETEEIPEWEDYLEGLGIVRKLVDFVPKFKGEDHIVVWDPLFTNVVRIIPIELAEIVIVLGQFPEKSEA
jgi:hypothetical protein